MFLRRMQKEKDRERRLAQTKKGKSKRLKARTHKLKKEHKDQMDAKENGLVYEQVIALKRA